MIRLSGFKRIIQALKLPNYGVYMAGMSVSMVGMWMQRVAVGWLTWELTGSATWLGAIAFADLFPAVLIAVAVGVAYSSFADYEGTTIGEIPSGLPPLGFDVPWGELSSLLLGGAVIALVGFAEPASIARTFAARERSHWDANREFSGARRYLSKRSAGAPAPG